MVGRRIGKGNAYRLSDTPTMMHENAIIEFLYEEGLSTMKQIAQHFDKRIDWANKICCGLLHEGRLTKQRVPNKTTYYWGISEEEVIEYERNNLQEDKQRQDPDLVRAA